MTQVATLEAAEAIRGRLERALLQEEVNLASENGRGRTEELIEETLRSYEAEALSGRAPALDSRERAGIAAELRNELIGLGAIAERMLADPVAQEWMINGPRRLFRDTGERIERVPDLVFDDDRQVRAFVERLLEQVEGKRLDRITPRRGAPSGRLRLTAAIPPVSSNGHTICTIRRFRLAAGTLDDLVGLGFLSEQAAAFLAACVRAGKNIVISGRVSSGKTTLLNALGRAVPGAERVVVCESSAELHPSQLRRVRGQAGERRRPRCGVARGPRLRRAAHEPDRILVGECRGPETMAMLWSFATGHAGMTSVHGESAEHAWKPRPLRPHRRRADRGRAGARLGQRRRSRRALRSPTQLHGQRTEFPAAADRRGRRSHGRRGTPSPPSTRSSTAQAPSCAGSAAAAATSTSFRAGRLPCGMTRRLGTVLIVLLLVIAAGCDSGDGRLRPSRNPGRPRPRPARPPSRMPCARRCAATTGCPATSSGGIGCRRGQHKRRAARRSSLSGSLPRIDGSAEFASERCPNRLEISSIELDPPTTATATVRSIQRVRPYRGGKPSSRAVKLDERADVELRRLGASDRFVVWKVRVLG